MPKVSTQYLPVRDGMYGAKGTVPMYMEENEKARVLRIFFCAHPAYQEAGKAVETIHMQVQFVADVQVWCGAVRGAAGS